MKIPGDQSCSGGRGVDFSYSATHGIKNPGKSDCLGGREANFSCPATHQMKTSGNPGRLSSREAGFSCFATRRLQDTRFLLFCNAILIVLKTIIIKTNIKRDFVFIMIIGEGDLLVMDMNTYNQQEKMLELKEELLAAEEDRLMGRQGYTLDELEASLEAAIEEV